MRPGRSSPLAGGARSARPAGRAPGDWVVVGTLAVVALMLSGCAETFTPVSTDDSVVQYGPDVEFPDTWPADFPLTEESVLLVAAAPEDAVSAILRTFEPYEEVVAFYDDELGPPYAVARREGGNNATRWHLVDGGLVEVITGEATEIGIELPLT